MPDGMATTIPAKSRSATPIRPRKRTSSARVTRARAKFQAFYPGGYHDESYIELERSYKWRAHEQWVATLNKAEYRRLLQAGQFEEISNRAVRIESRTNLLFSFEKMALRDAVRTLDGQRLFAQSLYEWLHGKRSPEARFGGWIEALGKLPRRQTRVLTWPLATVFGFLALPDEHMFLKPNVTRIAARAYGFEFAYQSRPSWPVYQQLLEFAHVVLEDTRDWRPRDMIDAQSFIWVQGSDEYQ